MLDMGFIHDIKRILERLPTERQSLLFSATFSAPIRRLAEELLREPVSIDAAPRNATAAPIRQIVHPVDRSRKRELLSHMLRGPDMDQALVFTRTKRGADRLAEQLTRDGIRAAAIHGNKNQSQRVRALTAFKRGDSQVLVATDIAARGLDIESLPHVVNFELPTVPEDYVHRIGRTGRAGQPGTAISLVALDEQDLIAGHREAPAHAHRARGRRRLRAELHGPRRSEPGSSGGRTSRPQGHGRSVVPALMVGANSPSRQVAKGEHSRGAYDARRDPGRGQIRRAWPDSAQLGHLSIRDGSASASRGADQSSHRREYSMPGERLSARRPSANRRTDRGQVGRPR